MSLFTRGVIVVLALLVPATALAQECAETREPALQAALQPVSGWQKAGHLALEIGDGIAMVGGLAVTGAVLIGTSAAWVQIAATVLAGYGLVRWGGVLVKRI